MEEARDSVRIAFLFAAGVVSASFFVHCCTQSESHLYIAASAALTGTVGVMFILMTYNVRAISSIPIFISGMMFLSGMTSFLSSTLILPADKEPCFFTRAASTAASYMSHIIDSIPYEDDNARAIVRAMTLGDRSGLSYEMKSAFRGSGASHLLALSGMHLGLIYMMFSKILSIAGNFPLVRKTRSVAIMAAAVFYTMMTGASPSITRACIFILLSETSNILLRKRSSIHILCMSLIIQLTISPNNISDIGFQLSYLAVAGIVFIWPGLRRIWPEEDGGKDTGIKDDGDFPIMRKIWNSATLSVSCQLLTAPAAWYYFGSFPLYFLLTNLLAIPVATLMMFLSIIAIVAQTAGICPAVLVHINETVVHALIYILETIATLPHATVSFR